MSDIDNRLAKARAEVAHLEAIKLAKEIVESNVLKVEVIVSTGLNGTFAENFKSVDEASAFLARLRNAEASVPRAAPPEWHKDVPAQERTGVTY